MYLYGGIQTRYLRILTRSFLLIGRMGRTNFSMAEGTRKDRQTPRVKKSSPVGVQQADTRFGRSDRSCLSAPLPFAAQ